MTSAEVIPSARFCQSARIVKEFHDQTVTLALSQFGWRLSITLVIVNQGADANGWPDALQSTDIRPLLESADVLIRVKRQFQYCADPRLIDWQLDTQVPAFTHLIRGLPHGEYSLRTLFAVPPGSTQARHTGTAFSTKFKPLA